MKHLAELYEQALKDYDQELTKRKELEQKCKRQKEVIDNIQKCFDDGHFEDGCDCLIIEKYIDNYLKEESE